ncbi:hypothetical protein DZD18_00210 [Rhodobacteraceae bacterium W635]|uniref:hypothetical protein n=1 Tax=Nioella halotolerans TaxID=2303578 RepID=UPI000E805BF9|nr:hypothetical protein DZD18_00210 [Rhodobacteraceae bacterium W635]
MTVPMIVALAVCIALGFAIAWLVGRFGSRALLRGVWLALVVIFAMLVWPSLAINMGWREGTGFDGVAEVFIAVVYGLPTLAAAVLGGWLGARRKARRAAG